MTSSAQRFSVGLTGGIGSGKTTVANLLGELGAALVDTDAIAHQLTAPGGLAIADIAAQFGADFIDAHGAACAPMCSATRRHATGSRRSCIR